jgi:hypothetical protein
LSILIRVFFVVFVLSFFAFDLFLSSFSWSFSGTLFDSPPPGPPAAIAGAVLDFELSRRLEVRAQVCRITLPHVGRDLVEVDEDEDVEEKSTFSVPAAPTAGASSSILCGLDVLSEEEEEEEDLQAFRGGRSSAVLLPPGRVTSIFLVCCPHARFELILAVPLLLRRTGAARAP